MGSKGKRRRGLTDEDHALWTAVAKSVEPLRGRAAMRAASDDVDDAPDVAPTQPLRKAMTAPRDDAPARPASAPSPPPLSPLGRRMRAQVVRGKLEIDARLDLHGHTQDEAHAKLLRFLRTAQARDARLVLVITGKGARSGERGVLKRQVPHWLGLPEFRALVIGFEDAHVAHGGAGALYVRVRRARES